MNPDVTKSCLWGLALGIATNSTGQQAAMLAVLATRPEREVLRDAVDETVTAVHRWGLQTNSVLHPACLSQFLLQRASSKYLAPAPVILAAASKVASDADPTLTHAPELPHEDCQSWPAGNPMPSIAELEDGRHLDELLETVAPDSAGGTLAEEVGRATADMLARISWLTAGNDKNEYRRILEGNIEALAVPLPPRDEH